MKITRTQLRSIIREYIDQQGNVSDDHNPSSDRFSNQRQQDDYEDTSSSHDRGFGWADFQAMAQTDDFQGAGDWLQDLAHDRGLSVDREIEDAMIQIGADPNSTAKDLEIEFEALTGGW